MTPAQAIAAARPGEVLTFADDEPLGAVQLGPKQAGVTVRGGVAEKLWVYGSGHRFHGVKVRQPVLGKASEAQCIRVVAQDIAFEGLDAEGSRDPEGYPNGHGLGIDSRSAKVSITGSKITGFWACLLLGATVETLVDDCELGRSRRSAILGTPGNNSRLSRLKVHTLTPRNYGGLGDHGCFIGIWTGPSDVEGLALDTITCEQRDGFPVMGISLYKTATNKRWVSPTLRNIAITSQHTQGITIQNADGAVLDRLASWCTRDPRGLPKPPQQDIAPMLFLNGCERPMLTDVWMQVVAKD